MKNNIKKLNKLNPHYILEQFQSQIAKLIL